MPGPQVAGCMKASSETSVFLQLVDTLLECVLFDWKDDNGFYREGTQRAKEKKRLAEFVKDKLGIRRQRRFLTAAPQRATDSPSVFTICRGGWTNGVEL